jgi:hypothetical protein
MSEKIQIAVLASAILLAACSSGVPRNYPVPEGAENPIKIEFRGATGADVVPIVAQVCSDMGMPTRQVDPSRGYVETRWVDVAAWDRTEHAAAYPLNERELLYVFEAGEGEGNMRVLSISAIYQPNRPTGTARGRNSPYNRMVPTDHPGYQVALQFDYRLRLAMTEAGVVPVKREEGQ